MKRRYVVRWALLIVGWLAVIVVALVVRMGNGLWWFAAGLVVASVVPRVWRWSQNDEEPRRPVERTTGQGSETRSS